MSCDLEVTNESMRCWGKNSYITKIIIIQHNTLLLEKQDQQHKSNVELREENVMLHKKGQSYIDNTVFKKNIGLT